MTVQWRIYRRRTTGFQYLGTVGGSDRTHALRVASQRYTDDGGALSAISDLSWGAMSTMERSVFLGTFRYAIPVLCKACGLEISEFVRTPEGTEKRRIGRKLQYHDACAPMSVLKHRLYHRRNDPERRRRRAVA